MIDVPTFTILSPYETYLGKIDNSIKGSVQIFNESFHTFLTGAAYTLSFKILKVEEDANFLKEGNKLAFVYKGKDYLITIVRVEEDQSSKTILGWADSLEQTKEVVSAYSATKAMTFTEYLNLFDHEKTITLGVNEVSTKELKLEWEGDDKRLGRILSLATKFDAEAEFEVRLNDDYTTYQWVLNVYKKFEEGVSQGIGEPRNDVKLRTGVNVKTLNRVVDTTEMYTAIRPYGDDNLTIASIDYKEYDSDGKLLYFTEKGNSNILAPQARDKFPSNMLSKASDRYQALPWSFSTKSVDMLFGQALAHLKKISQPTFEYTIEGSFDLNLGDTVVIEDESYTPRLILTARVSEQEICWTNPANSKTIFSNFVESESEVSENLLSRVEELIAQNKIYTGSIQSNNGIIFKNDSGTTELTAIVRDSSTDLSSNFSFEWFKDGTSIAKTQKITVKASDVSPKAVYMFEAKDSTGKLRATYEVTVTNVSDGTNGTNGRGVKSSSVDYQASTSGTVPPTGAWLTNPPTVSAGQYLWTRTTFVYTDNSTTLAYSIGRVGTNGTSGSAGVGVADVTVTYQSGTSGTTPPTGSWTESIPSVAANQYLWTRTVTTYTDNSKSTGYSVGKMGANGADAQLLYLSATSNVMAFDADDIVKTGQSISIVAKLQNVTGTATFTAIPYIGNTAQTAITLSGSGNQRLMTNGNWSNASWTSIAITATLGGLTDTLSITKLKDGKAGPKGDVGNQGIKGENGADGKPTYTHWAYAWSADGKDGFTTSYPGENRFKYSLFRSTNGWSTGSSDPLVSTLQRGEYMLYNKTQVTSSRSFISATSENPLSFEKGVKYSASIEIFIENSMESIGGSTFFVRTYLTNGSVNDFGAVAISSSTPTGTWVRLEINGVSVNEGSDPSRGVQFTVALANNTTGRIRIRKPKFEEADTSTSYTPSPSEDFALAYPSFAGSYVDNLPTDSEDYTKYTWQRILGQDGKDGKDGTNGSNGTDGKDAQEVFSGYLSNDSIVVPANPSGTVTDFSKATGTFITFLGQEQLSSGVTYSLVSQTGMTATINSSTGAYSVSAASADMGSAIFKAVRGSITIQKQLIVVKARQGTTGATGSTGATGATGATGKDGADGNPTGIIAQNTVPTASQRYVGMLWKNTGASGYINGATYRWNGSAFELFIFVAENISASNLAAISANLGTVTAGTINGVTINGSKFVNSFSYVDSGVTYTGTTTIENGNVIISRSGSNGSIWTTKLDRLTGFEDNYQAAANAPARITRLGEGTLYMAEAGVGGYLPAGALNPVGWTNFTYASGFTTAENNPCQYRKIQLVDGSWELQLRGQIRPTSGSFSTTASPTGGNLPAGYRPVRNELVSVADQTKLGARVVILSTGDVQINTPNGGTYVSFGGIRIALG